jgi:hypothetical protein
MEGVSWDAIVDGLQVRGESYSRGNWSFGLRIADERGSCSLEDLRLRQAKSPIYLRDAHDALRETIRGLEGGHGFVLANSAAMFERLRVLYPKLVLISNEPEKVMNGVWRFKVQNVVDARLVLARIGATPSLYTMLQRAEDSHAPIRPCLSPFVAPSKCGNLLLDCARKMVAGFRSMFDGASEVSVQLEHAIQGMQATDSAVRRCRLLELIGDEIFAALCAARPFHDCAIEESVSARYGLPQSKTFLFSGGMVRNCEWRVFGAHERKGCAECKPVCGAKDWILSFGAVDWRSGLC